MRSWCSSSPALKKDSTFCGVLASPESLICPLLGSRVVRDFHLTAKVRIKPSRSCMRHTRSTAVCQRFPVLSAELSRVSNSGARAYTLNPKHSILQPQRESLFLDAQPSIPKPQPYTINPKP